MSATFLSAKNVKDAELLLPRETAFGLDGVIYTIAVHRKNFPIAANVQPFLAIC